MIIKKYEGNTKEEALLKAQEELGKDAVVMNVKTLKRKGIFGFLKKSTVEITVALDEKNEIVKEETKKTKVVVPNPNILPEEESKDTESSNAIEEKLNNLAEILEKKIVKAEDKEEKKVEYNPVSDVNEEETKSRKFISLIKNQLSDNEVDSQYIDNILDEINFDGSKEFNLDNLLAKVYQKLVLKLGVVETIKLSESKPKVVFFVGPTGVGKTTTIAKVASKFKLEQNAKIAFITADTYRIAAVDQLKTYANILSIPIEIVYNTNEINKAVDKFKGYDLVFVDTAGRSHKNKEQCEEISELINNVESCEKEVYLVLSATTKYKDLIKIADKYKEFTDYRLIFTKLDETAGVGNILNIKLLTQFPLSYSTWGQDVPDDLGVINPQVIAKQLLGGN